MTINRMFPNMGDFLYFKRSQARRYKMLTAKNTIVQIAKMRSRMIGS